MECGVRSVECGVGSVEWGVGSGEWGVGSRKCGAGSVECGMPFHTPFNGEWGAGVWSTEKREQKTFLKRF